MDLSLSGQSQDAEGRQRAAHPGLGIWVASPRYPILRPDLPSVPQVKGAGQIPPLPIEPVALFVNVCFPRAAQPPKKYFPRKNAGFFDVKGPDCTDFAGFSPKTDSRRRTIAMQ
jgi:hypothetical protein